MFQKYEKVETLISTIIKTTNEMKHNKTIGSCGLFNANTLRRYMVCMTGRQYK